VTIESQPQEKPEEAAQNDDSAIVIEDVNPAVELVTVADLAKLPASTPQSFIEYMTKELEASTVNEIGCVTQYTISKVSSLNISGGTTGINPEMTPENPEYYCGGGAKTIWSIDQSTQEWSVVGLQSIQLCSDISNVYTEFIQSCIKSVGGDEVIENPNGSIYDAI
jgi:hypothetical protein